MQTVVNIGPLPPLEQLRSTWKELEARANASFYISWDWIGVWVERAAAGRDLRLWSAMRDGVVVALGILVRGQRKLAGLPFCESWHLHCTGDEFGQQLWVEHNDLLVDQRHGNVRSEMLDHWSKVANRASELHLPGLHGDGWPAQVIGRLDHTCSRRMSGAVSLDLVRQKQFDFTAVLGAHARRFVRRSVKEYQTLGPIAVEVADTREEALAALERLGELHARRWEAKGQASLFRRDAFVEFHRTLALRSLGDKRVQFLRVRAGPHDIGVLYSFVLGDRVYVYQSGFDYGLLEKHGRPGLVTHTMAIQHNARLGFKHYDMLAGESRYKATLATEVEPMTWAVLRKPALRFRLESGLRRLKDHWAARVQKKDAEADTGGPAVPSMTDHLGSGLQESPRPALEGRSGLRAALTDPA